MAQSTTAIDADERAEVAARARLLAPAKGLAAAPFAPAAAVLVIWLVWTTESGGYFPRDWYPAALVLTVMVAVVAAARRQLLPPSRRERAALALLGAFVAWSFLSLLWALSRGSALEAASELLLYLLGAWTLSLVPWRDRSALLVLATWSLAVAVVCAIALVGALTSSHLAHYIVDARWSEPTRYANATAALAAMAFWPAVLLASRRRSSAAVQLLGLCAAVFLVEFSLLPQSRGSAIAMVAMTPVVVLLSPSRLRLLLRLAVVAGAVAMTVGPIYDVFTAAEFRRPVAPVLDHAARLMLLSVGLTAVAGAALMLGERLIRPSELTLRRARLGSIGLAVLAVLCGATLVTVNSGRIERSVSHRWKTFTSSTRASSPSGSRLTASDAHARHEMWRVALNTFAESPLHGVGAGNFERVYTEKRRVREPSRYAHSIWLRFLAETGAVGAVIFLAFVAVVLAGLVRSRRALEEDGRAVVVACVAVTVYFLLHASVDWLDVMPVIAAPAFALPFVALRAASATRGDPPPRRGRRLLSGRPVAAAAAVGTVAALVVLAFPYLSVRYVDRGRLGSATDPAAAFKDFDRAASMNPLSAQPHLAAGTLAVDRGRERLARREFRRALALEDGWYPHFELALLDEASGRRASARAEIARAASLNPHSAFIDYARQLIGSGARIDPAAVNRRVLDRALDNTGPVK